MENRRNFIKTSMLGGVALLTPLACKENVQKKKNTNSKVTKPIVISTWKHGVQANKVSFDILEKGGTALDAVERGVRVVESDPDNLSVGLGGLPDKEGKVTLDACIMNHKNQCGSVAFLQNIENPISVARKVMEDTPHIMLAGEGAYLFAIEKGFPHKELLTPKAEILWKKWLEKSKYEPIINIENHDTISSLALDSQANLSGACTTSGLAYKMHGRVGDSPIIGAGLFVDNEVGAACATGIGEAVIRVAGSACIVEMMRNGMNPQDACKAMVNRIIAKHDNVKNIQVGFLALNKNGEYGSYSVHKGFNYSVISDEENNLKDALHIL